MPEESTSVRMLYKSDKNEFPCLDALYAGFAVVAFDVYVNLGVANKAEGQKHKIYV